MNTPSALILDFGSQYTQLIARKVRQLGVYAEVHSHRLTVAQIQQWQPQAIILSGGPNSVWDHNAPQLDPALLDLGIPILGICYGMHALAQALGAEVKASPQREYGAAVVHWQTHRLTAGCPADSSMWMSHGDSVLALPPHCSLLAHTDTTAIAGFACDSKKIYALQCHPEVDHSEHGLTLLENFLIQLAHCPQQWNMDHYRDQVVKLLQQQIGDGEVIVGLSGGVDSTVAALLIHRAIGSKMHAILVDNGLLRHNEADEVMALGQQHDFVIHKIDAQEQFLSALKGQTDPETKRKIIGRVFIEVFEQQAKTFGHAQFLAQGTIYPDVIESAGIGQATVIKSHHNVGGLPEKLKLQLVEPLKRLFKDEVRTLGRTLGLPPQFVDRHPFPGPGLAVRILGEVHSDALRLLRQADAIYLEELRRHGLYHQIAQAFAVFLPVKTVGVMGDERTYDNVIALRAVSTSDFMTAQPSAIAFDVLFHIAQRIVNEVRGINRVVYDLSSKPPATIEWE